MNHLIRLVWLSSILVLSSLASAQFNQHAFLWSANGGMQDLGTLPEWQDSIGAGIDRYGAVVGSDSSMGNSTAFAWTAANGMKRLSGLSTTSSDANGVNNAGQVVGATSSATGQVHGFLWSRAAGVQDLGDLGGGLSVAAAINKSTVVVGWSTTASGLTRAFVWTQAQGMQDLLSLSSRNCATCDSNAYAENDSGAIVGSLGVHLGVPYAFLYNNGHLWNLGDLGGQGNQRGSVAYGVNKAGEVVGGAYTPSGQVHPFLWSPSTGMQDLGLLTGCQAGYAQGINISGQVVGWCTDSNNTHAFLWTASDGMEDLGTLGGPEAQAFAINDAGQVTGLSNSN